MSSTTTTSIHFHRMWTILLLIARRTNHENTSCSVVITFFHFGWFSGNANIFSLVVFRDNNNCHSNNSTVAKVERTLCTYSQIANYYPNMGMNSIDSRSYMRIRGDFAWSLTNGNSSSNSSNGNGTSNQRMCYELPHSHEHTFNLMHCIRLLPYITCSICVQFGRIALVIIFIALRNSILHSILRWLAFVFECVGR